jgi:iron complex outermembrane receptor protein
MSSPHFKLSIIACAVLQAFAAPAAAQSTGQTMTEVVVSASRMVPLGEASVGGFGDASLLETPASITAIGEVQMQELNILQSTDAMKFESSVSDSYNAVGYAEQFSIRGFDLNNDSSYRKDGIAIPNDTQIPLENKSRIEVLKGLSGMQSGVSSAGGIVNYAVKRPTANPLRKFATRVSDRGTTYGAIDLGGRFEDKRLGYRVNAALEKMHSYVKGADGERQFVSGAFDWQVTPSMLIQLDADYQHKAQITAPGYQLIRGTELPVNVSPKMLLNDQPWTRPVDTKSANFGLRLEYLFANDWRATLTMNKHEFRRDDYTAFPYGCSNEGDGFYPGYCSNGDYDVYDYQSVGERKSPFGAQALLQGGFSTGTVRHKLSVGAAFSKRRDAFGDYVYDYAGSSNIYDNVHVPPAANDPDTGLPPVTGPVFERRNNKERSIFVHDIVSLSEQMKLHAGLRYVELDRHEFNADLGTYIDKTADFVLPSLALVYSPAKNWNLYGSYAQGMEHGGVAPMDTENEFEVLDPSRSKQLEFGVKGVFFNDVSMTAALFQISQNLQYIDNLNTFVNNGDRTHRGLELSAQGSAGADLKYSVSMMALKTEQSGTNAPSIDGKRVTNVPSFKSTSMLEYALPMVEGLKVRGIWQYSARKAFDVENTTWVPGFHLFDLHASYNTKLAGTSVTVRAGVDNVFNKFYWRDVTPALGGYLIPGAPRRAFVSAQFDF